MDCSMPGLPVPNRLLEFAQVHVHWIGNAIQVSYPLTPSSPSALNLSQHQGLFQWVGSSHQVVKTSEPSPSASVLPMNIQGWFTLELTGLISLQSKGLSRVFSKQFKSINSSAFSFLYSPTLPSIHDYWKSIALTIWTFIGKMMSLLFNMCLSGFVLALLPRSKRLSISWLQSPSAMSSFSPLR